MFVFGIPFPFYLSLLIQCHAITLNNRIASGEIMICANHINNWHISFILPIDWCISCYNMGHIKQQAARGFYNRGRRKHNMKRLL